MIVTVTPNPAIDRTLHLGTLVRGTVQRALSESVEPSGKGVNVSIALHRSGVPTLAVLPTGGASGLLLDSMLDAAGVPHLDVAIAGAVRTNISLIEADGTTTKVNEQGPSLTSAEVRALVRAASTASVGGDWVAWCGSLPQGFAAEVLGEAVAAARSAGTQVALDTSGAVLAAVLSQPGDRLPHVIKPNGEELAELTGRTLATVGDVADAAAILLERGVRTVLVSLGPDGAVLVQDGLRLHGLAPVSRVVNTVGAGDAFLAGYLAATHDGGAGGAHEAAAALESALRYAASAVQHTGTLTWGPDAAVEVAITACRTDRPLDVPAHPPRASSRPQRPDAGAAPRAQPPLRPDGAS